MVDTAWQDGHRVLYHWQGFNEKWLEQSLATRAIYCASPSAFNDPWDCKAHFNTEILDDPTENERHVKWAVDLCRKRNHSMSETDIAQMEVALRHDKARATKLISEMSTEVSADIASRYRVYCLGPDVGNLLMWAHYANSHQGVCLEFSLRNEVMCFALRCEYLDQFPLVRAHSQETDENFRILLGKATAWKYEREYRLVTQERSLANANETLMTDNGMLRLPQGALTAVIVGCQGDFDKINALVHRAAPDVKVKRAIRVPNRYEICIKE